MYLSFGLLFYDKLEGALNFIPWKEMMTLFLEECELWEINEKHVTIPTDPTTLVEYHKNNVKAQRIILDVVKYHIMPQVTSKKNAFDMRETLKNCTKATIKT